MQGAMIINWSRYLQLIPWLAYSALQSLCFLFHEAATDWHVRTVCYKTGPSLFKRLLHMCIPTAERTFPVWWYLGEAKLTSRWILCLAKRVSGQSMPGIILVPITEMCCSELWDFPGVLQSISGFLIQVSDFSRS